MAIAADAAISIEMVCAQWSLLLLFDCINIRMGPSVFRYESRPRLKKQAFEIVGGRMDDRSLLKAEGEGSLRARAGLGIMRCCASWSEADRAALVPHLEMVPFRNGDMIARAGDPADSICFPLTGIAAVLDSLEGDRRYAVALVGNEGFIGWPLLLGDGQMAT